MSGFGNIRGSTKFHHLELRECCDSVAPGLCGVFLSLEETIETSSTRPSGAVVC